MLITFQVIESLAMEDTDIKPQHIEQIKELIKKEVVLEEEVENSPDNSTGADHSAGPNRQQS